MAGRLILWSSMQSATRTCVRRSTSRANSSMNRDTRVLLAEVARVGMDIQSFTEGMECAMFVYYHEAPENVWDCAWNELADLLQIVKPLLAELGPLEE